MELLPVSRPRRVRKVVGINIGVDVIRHSVVNSLVQAWLACRIAIALHILNSLICRIVFVLSLADPSLLCLLNEPVLVVILACLTFFPRSFFLCIVEMWQGLTSPTSHRLCSNTGLQVRLTLAHTGLDNWTALKACKDKALNFWTPIMWT